MNAKNASEQVSLNIKKLLELYSMNILELSNKTGISYSTLHKIVNNKSNPTVDTLGAIAEVFNLDLVQLFSQDLLREKTGTLIVSVPVLPLEEIYKTTRSIIRYVNIQSDKTISEKAFATADSRFSPFSTSDGDTLLFFDAIKSSLIHYNRKIVISHLPQHPAQLKRILVDANDIFLEDLENKTPCRKPIPDEQIDYFLLSIKVDFK
jgi:transcriptional regulator with XRE-family HTH domain